MSTPKKEEARKVFEAANPDWNKKEYRKYPRIEYSKELLLSVLKLHKDFTYLEIANKLNVPAHTVGQVVTVLRKNGAYIPKKPKYRDSKVKESIAALKEEYPDLFVDKSL